MNDDPKIYVVDDDDDVRASVVALVSQMGLPVQAFASAEAFLAIYQGERPACLLTDHRMLGMTGVELLESLRTRGVSVAVIVMTAFAETELTVRAIRSGAITLLEKPFTSAALWDAINEALAEDRSLVADEAQRNRIAAQFETLTDQELDVLRQIVKGETNKAVAFALDVSIRTVENRRSRIFEKMDVTSVAQLVQLVMLARPDLC